MPTRDEWIIWFSWLHCTALIGAAFMATTLITALYQIARDAWERHHGYGEKADDA